MTRFPIPLRPTCRTWLVGIGLVSLGSLIAVGSVEAQQTDASMRASESIHEFVPTTAPDAGLLAIAEVDEHDRAPLAKLGPMSSTVVPLDGRSEMVILEPLLPAGVVTSETRLAVRSTDDGHRSDWQLLHTQPEEGPDGTPGGEGSGERSAQTSGAIGPIWVGEGTTQIEVVLLDGQAASLRVEALDAPGVQPAVDGDKSPSAKVSASWGLRPAIRSNADWGSPGFQRQNAGCSEGPRYADSMRAMVVHHTVTTNGYGQDEVPKLLQGIHRFHTKTRGWCDVAYNFLVDRFGTIWEGRSGGIDRPVIGGHARGFNSNTFAVALLGQHQGGISNPPPAHPSAASLQAVEALGAWKLRLHGVDPNGTTLLKNTATDGVMKHPPSQYVEVPTILAHRDLGVTSCPGNRALPVVGEMKSTFTPRHTGTVPYVMEGVTGGDFGPKLLAVDSYGGLRPGLAQAAPANPPGGAGAPAIAVGGTPTAGYVLAADGTLRPYGDAPAVSGKPGGSNPVDLIVRDSGTSGYVITSDGFLHGFGGRVRDRSSNGSAVAGDVTDDILGYTVSRSGVLNPIGDSPPARLNAPMVGQAIDLSLFPSGKSGLVLSDIGEVIGFGGATNFGDVVPSTPVAVVAGPNANGGWVLDTEGRWWTFGDERPVVPSSTNRGVNAAVDAVRTGYDTTGSSFRQSSDFDYITGVYQRILGRSPTAGQLDHWNWKTDHQGTIALGREMVRQSTFIDGIVDTMYRRALNREPDAAGRAYWTALLRDGGLSVKKMGIYFYGSKELYLRSGSPEGYIEALYRSLLHREPDAEGRAYWVERLRSGRLSPAGVTREFYNSLESRRDRVDSLYRQIAGVRPADEIREEWAAALLSSDDLSVAARMIASPTYYRFLVG